VTVVFQTTIDNCTDCLNHKVLSDPDRYDWFCSDDVKVVCTTTKDRPITVACRPYRMEKECEVPAWCPLREGGES